MSYQKDMQKCQNYIMNNVSKNVTPSMLAELCNYSYYHFCHVFKVWFGMPVGEYIRDERLLRATKMLLEDKRISDIALDCGFDTPSGFNKAFRRKYGMNPTEYKQKYDAKAERGLLSMNVKFESKETIKAIGYLIPPKGDAEVNMKDAGAYWEGADFSSVSAEEYAKVADSNNEVGLWIHPDLNSGDLSYFFGAIVDCTCSVPDGLAAIEIPAADYAVFKTNPVNLKTDWQSYAGVIRACWKEIFENWFDGQEEYAYDQEKYCFEYYASENGDLDSEEATVDLYVPVKKK